MKGYIDEIRKEGYTVIGVRGLADDENYEVGEICRNSYEWDYEEDRSTFETGANIELNGTCAKGFAIDLFWDEDQEIEEKINDLLADFNYCGQRVIVAGKRYENGSDNGEVIIEDAKVICKL